MNGSKVPLLAALAFIVLYVVGTAFLGTPLPVDASSTETALWLHDRRDAVPVMVVSFALAIIPFVILTAHTRAVLPDLYGHAFLVAASAFAAQAAVSLWFYAGTALHADSIAPATARALLDVAAFFGPVLTTTMVVLAGAVALAALRAEVLPRWFGWVSAVFAVEQLAEVATVYGRTGFAAPGGEWNNVLGAGMFGLWAVALGFALSRVERQPSA